MHQVLNAVKCWFEMPCAFGYVSTLQNMFLEKKHSSFAYLVVGYLEGNQIFLASIIIRMHQKCFMEMKKFKQRTGLWKG